MANKAGKAPRSRASKRAPPPNPQNSVFQFSEGSLFAESKKFIDETNAQPFRDFAYILLAVLVFLVWRLFSAYSSKHSDAISIWSLFTWGLVGMINLWSFMMVMICKKRGGDIGVARVTDEDVLRAIWMTGVVGGWLGLATQRYKLTDRSFMLKVAGVSVINLLWFILIGVKRVQDLSQ
ncbi:hypothetical protein DFQ27_008299 [Actinomortierella ambigua]|uniref:DUF1294 domain-containing protein n=1 Tax=Actinomortierella ambigua TaxID=1343610 RepID=A0A9P6PTB0_9FUNG|nr:hypothetical protein DFQ27_008299 [Actinomortierella ambigua]